MDRRRFLAGAGAAAGLAGVPAGGALAQTRLLDAEGEALVTRLAEPGVHAIMRHAVAPGTGDPAGFTLADCSTQRTLGREGRVQAVLTGRMLKQARARFRLILSSQWCRCLETARLLGMGTVTEEPLLNSFFEAREEEEAQTEGLRRLLAESNPSATLMLVTHQVNITALIGGVVREGEVIVFRAGADGGTERLGSVIAPEVDAERMRAPARD